MPPSPWQDEHVEPPRTPVYQAERMACSVEARAKDLGHLYQQVDESTLVDHISFGDVRFALPFIQPLLDVNDFVLPHLQSGSFRFLRMNRPMRHQNLYNFRSVDDAAAMCCELLAASALGPYGAAWDTDERWKSSFFLSACALVFPCANHSW